MWRGWYGRCFGIVGFGAEMETELIVINCARSCEIGEVEIAVRGRSAWEH